MAESSRELRNRFTVPPRPAKSGASTRLIPSESASRNGLLT